jgi:hypothetical protein
VTQQGLRYLAPAALKPPLGEKPAPSPGGPPLHKITTRTDRNATDMTVFSDRPETMVNFFQRNRVAVGSLTVADYEVLLRTTAPWLELDMDPIAFNDETPSVKRTSRKVRVAPPPAAVETSLLRPILKTSPHAQALTVILRRDGPDGALVPVGFTTFRTAYQFFDKDVRLTPSSEVTQRDLRRTAPAAQP